MHRRLYVHIAIFIAAILFAACNRVPDNTRYIPADATAVVGVNLKSLGRKIAWNLITGSRLYKEMQKQMSAQGSADAIKGIENAGIDVANTFYAYTRSDTRFEGGNLRVALLPLADVQQWEQYVARIFPDARVVVRNGYKEANLGPDMYVGWDNELLIIVNGWVVDEDGDGSDALLQAEMSRAFMVPSGSNIATNARFDALARAGHDFSFWLNYGNLLTDIAGESEMEFNGVSVSSASWRDAVITLGLDFRKGKISGDVAYYLPAQVEEATRDFGLVTVDKDLLDRMPKQKLDMLLAMHISPAGVKKLMETAGLFGPLNVGLTTQGLDVDYVLDAFTGDMVIAMNNFSLGAETHQEKFMGQIVDYKQQKASMNMTYAVKVNNYENFSHILEMTAGSRMMKSPDGYVLPLTWSDSLHLTLTKQYAAMSNMRSYAAGIPAGDYKNTRFNAGISDKIYGSPFSLYFDIRQMLGMVDPAVSNSPRDSAIISESKKLLESAAIYGGNYIDNAYKFSIEVNFLDKDENSILELIDFGMRINQLSQMEE